jgi:hypothetical protein
VHNVGVPWLASWCFALRLLKLNARSDLKFGCVHVWQKQWTDLCAFTVVGSS